MALSSEAKDAAAEIERRLQLGSKLSEIVKGKEDVVALFGLYKNEGYILSEHMGKFCVSWQLTSLLMSLDFFHPKECDGDGVFPP